MGVLVHTRLCLLFSLSHSAIVALAREGCYGINVYIMELTETVGDIRVWVPQQNSVIDTLVLYYVLHILWVVLTSRMYKKCMEGIS